MVWWPDRWWLDDLRRLSCPVVRNAAKNPRRNKEIIMDFLSSLLDRFRGRPQDLTGGGMAQQAGNILADRPYQLYMQESQQMGEQPMPYEQWKAMQMQQPQQQPVNYQR